VSYAAQRQRESSTAYDRAAKHNTLATSQVPKILALIDIVIKHEGTQEAACRVLGIASNVTISRWREGSLNMSTPRAHAILANYKLWKKSRP
jgi:hypothetical protein